MERPPKLKSPTFTDAGKGGSVAQGKSGVNHPLQIGRVLGDVTEGCRESMGREGTGEPSRQATRSIWKKSSSLRWRETGGHAAAAC